MGQKLKRFADYFVSSELCYVSLIGEKHVHTNTAKTTVLLNALWHEIMCRFRSMKAESKSIVT